MSGRWLVRIATLTILVALAACASDGGTPRSLTTSGGPLDAGRPPDGAQSPPRGDVAIDTATGDTGAGGQVPDVATDITSPNAPDLSARVDGVTATDSGVSDTGGAVDGANSVEGGARLRCNGHEGLCDRGFDEVVFPASHNAMSNADDNWFAANQEHGIARQLQDGIRALLLDTFAWKGALYLCHGVCDLGNRPLVEGLRDIAAFLRGNPGEVVALLIEDHISPVETERAFAESGLLEWAYVHPAGTEWPTLRSMIDSGRRLLVTAENQRSALTWYHHLWDLASDTPYTFRNAQEFSCAANRGMRGNDLFLLNHWLENPLASPLLSRSANARALLLDRARACQTERGRLPNFVAVNHYATGDLFAVVRQLNGLSP